MNNRNNNFNSRQSHLNYFTCCMVLIHVSAHIKEVYHTDKTPNKLLCNLNYVILHHPYI
jgi:hypothetical protein